MPGVRELLAVVLGALLGVVLVAAPSAFLGPQRRRRGDYGSDDDVSETWAWVVRALGIACIAVAAVIGYQAYA